MKTADWRASKASSFKFYNRPPMGHHQSSFNKANFRRGIRGYRQMFAALHLEESELKKLWVEFGKIDTDNGGTVGTLCGGGVWHTTC